MSGSLPRFRVKLWDIGASRGRGNLVAFIEDAKEVGGSGYANQAGEFFMTLPYNHPQIAQIVPLQRHYEVSRLDSTGAYVPVFSGLIDDYEATENEIVVYGRDYLSLLETTISGANTSYAAASIGAIVTAQLSAARAEANSRVGFIGLGTIDTTSVTATLLTSYEPRLHFLANVLAICAGSRTVRPIIAVEPRTSGTPSFTFTENKGSDKTNVVLEWGANVTRFAYKPGWADFRTRVDSIGQKRAGATILYSTQTYANEATYGWITEGRLWIDIVDQAALDARAQREARKLGRTNTGVNIVVQSNALGPWDGYDLGDAITVRLQRGSLVSVDTLFTVWGLEWIGHRNGSESLFLALEQKDT